MLQHVDAVVGMGAADEEDLPEALKGVDQGEDHGKEDTVPHLGCGDVQEFLPSAGAVQGRGVIVVFWNGHQTGQQQDHAVARVFPEVQQHHDPEREVGIQQVINGQAQSVKSLIDHTALCEQQLHQQHRTHHRHDVRQQEDGLQRGVLLHLVFQQQGDGIGHDEDQRQGDHQEFQGIAVGQPEDVVVQHVHIVFQADPAAGVAAALGQGVGNDQEKGNEVEDHAPHKQRSYEQITISGLSQIFDGFFHNGSLPFRVYASIYYNDGSGQNRTVHF